MQDLPEPIETVQRILVRPDAGVLRAIGLNHGFESAIADLVDNSLDAKATRVLIRFVLQHGLVVRLLVADNGVGMDAAGIDDAMRLGRPKSDSETSLGHFGMGLKSASFSQASTLTVLSRKASSPAEGRRMYREPAGGDFEVDVLASDAVEAQLNDVHPMNGAGESGTLVQWDDCRTFPASRDSGVTTSFLELKVAELRNHLGLVFHRLLERGGVFLGVDVWDADLGEAGLEFVIEPVNPFGYTRSGMAGYPKRLNASYNGRTVPLDCHIWPGSSDSAQYRLYGRPLDSFQGFYLYRNDRVLLAGGWCGVAHETKSLRLARVAIDIEDHLDGFSMSMEKQGVRIVADLVHAIEHATGDGSTFREYLDDATDAFKASNRRVRRRTPILPPGQGLHYRIKRAIEREAPILDGELPVRIRWKRLDGEDLVEVDRENRVLWLNARYRPVVLRGERGNVNDAPLIKSLLFLIYEDLFRGLTMGVKDKENQRFWNEVLTTAVQVEERNREADQE